MDKLSFKNNCNLHHVWKYLFLFCPYAFKPQSKNLKTSPSQGDGGL